jgi:hypothetical protein
MMLLVILAIVIGAALVMAAVAHSLGNKRRRQSVSYTLGNKRWRQ